MKVVWLTKRHYTHKDALREQYGRVYQLPLAWANAHATETTLELVDYYGREQEATTDGIFRIASTPIRSLLALRSMVQRITALRPDTVIASGDCFLGLLGLRLARQLGARFAFDIYDDYRRFGAHRAFLGWDAYGHLLERADLVFYASEALAAQHSSSTPWHLVPNGIDPGAFRPWPMADARSKAGLADDGTRWVGYFGGLEPERGPEDLVAAVELLRDSDPSVRLVMCGTAHRDVDLDRPWIDFRGNVPHTLIPDYINSCDVVVLPYRRGPIIDMASSCKIAEYLFCDRPVVATSTPNLLSNFRVQARELGPALCKPGDPADLARAIDHQLRLRIVASRPEGHTWAAIAQDTLAVLRDPGGPSKKSGATR